jgi:tripartite-type tricarboxylate transporter receptor subunit TctC
MSFDTVTPVLPFIKEGKLKPLAVTTAKRSSTLPNVPTLQEAGVPGIAIGTWFGLLAPAATPKDVVTKLNAEVVKIIHTPEFKKQMFDIGAEPIGNKPEEMAKQIKEETEKFAGLVKAGKVTLD